MSLTAPPTAPGVRREDVAPPPPVELATGVPVLLGYAAGGPVGEPVAVTGAAGVAGVAGGHLAPAVAAFFANGGARAYVVRLDDDADPLAALAAGLDAMAVLDDADLVCAPDAVRPAPEATAVDPVAVAAQQQLLLERCDAGGTRLALLDALPGAAPADVLDQAAGLAGDHGALYWPWPADDDGRWVPPCGHVAGVIASLDAATGVHAAPANVALSRALDLERDVDDATQAPLDAAGVNCLRAFPGRGIRIWGARTLSREPEWRFVNVRRLVSTLARWLALAGRDLAFEPAGPATWARLERLLSGRLNELYRQGALAGATPASAFQVRCDETTNPPGARDAGLLSADVLLAPAPPAEQVIVRLVRHPAGVSVESAGP